ncbi:hypothetical protein COOONC_15942 [Cooperia oncophora]
MGTKSERIQDIQRIACLRQGNIIAASPMDEANLLAEHFGSCSAFCIVDLIIKWPVSFVVTPDFVPFIILFVDDGLQNLVLINSKAEVSRLGGHSLCYTHSEEEPSPVRKMS